MILRWALHFASGNSLFTGVLIMVTVCILMSLTRLHRYRRTLRLTLLLGVILVAFSGTPFPWWVYAVWMALLVGWLFAGRQRRQESKQPRLSRSIGLAFAGFSLTVGAVEFTSLFPRIPPGSHQTMYVIGDSITAGLEDSDVVWPTRLAESHQVDVINLAQQGAKADSAMKQVQQIPTGAAGIVLIEIGGNDLLSGKRSDLFGQELKSLLDAVAAPNRTLVMMELPLPPFANEYGRVQRRLAGEYNVVLISKREFARVLGMADGTVDGVHLSANGQQLMAEIIWHYVEPLFAPSRPRSGA